MKNKKCPFDGGEGELDKEDRFPDLPKEKENFERFAFFIICKTCSAIGGWSKNEVGAWRLWNLRTP